MVTVTKNERQGINIICEQMYDYVKYEWNDRMEPWSDCGRLRACQARVYESNDYIVLVSYNTLVAFIDKNEEIFVDVLRLVWGYTATSAQHIAKFRQDYGHGCRVLRYDDRGC
jgi:hypothetical protein